MVPRNGTAALTTQEDNLERKYSAHHAEDETANKGNDTVAVPVSAFAGLSFKETLRTFWKTTMFCVLALFLACSDGFQFQLPGNLVAQTSFIRKCLTYEYVSRSTKSTLTIQSNSVLFRLRLEWPSMLRPLLHGAVSTVPDT
jgi:hypothetical protein